MICSALWRDLRIYENIQKIGHCPKQNRYPVSIDEIKYHGADLFYKNPNFLKTKKQMINDEKFADLCSTCSVPIFEYKNIWKTSFPSLDKDYNYLNQIDYIFSPVCNQACMYCNDNHSNQWSKLLGKKPNADENWDNAIRKSFLSFLKKYKPNNVCINFLGGEPFLNLPALIDLCSIMLHADNVPPNIRIKITTNLNVKTELIEQFLCFVKKYPDVKFFIAPSIDSINSRAENIRTGLDFNLFMKNLQFIVSSNAFKRIIIIPTINALNIKNCKDFFEYFITFFEKNNYSRFKFASNSVIEPRAMAINILPKAFKKDFQTGLDYLKKKSIQYPNLEETVNKLSSIINMIDTDRSEINLKKYRQWYEWQGNLKNLNYFQLFPELNEIL